MVRHMVLVHAFGGSNPSSPAILMLWISSEMIVYKKVSYINPVVDYLSKKLILQLEAGGSILWLVPGGSANKVAVDAAKLLPQGKLQNLTVTLTDERYGPIGHDDSNWPQLKESGLNLSGADMQPVLRGDSLEQTVEIYGWMLEEKLRQADYSIALAGMGADGHIFGIKPHSPSVKTDRQVIGYGWDDYIRITPTSGLLRQLDEVVVYAVGKEKWKQLDDLKKDLSDKKQPAQILKRLKKVVVFNDYEGTPS